MIPSSTGHVAQATLTRPRAALLEGAATSWPLLLSIVPFGMITGVAAIATGFSLPLAMGMTVIIFAGASQLATMHLLTTGAAVAVTVLTASMINLRFLLYSASLAPHFQHLPLHWKLLLAYFTTDPSYGITIGALNEQIPTPMKHWYYAGAAGLLWVGWIIGTLTGALLGTQIPTEWSLDFAISLNFIAVLIPSIRDRATLLSALVGGGVAIVARGLPFNLGLIVGALCGIGAGLLLEQWQRREQQP